MVFENFYEREKILSEVMGNILMLLSSENRFARFVSSVAMWAIIKSLVRHHHEIGGKLEALKKKKNKNDKAKFEFLQSKLVLIFEEFYVKNYADKCFWVKAQIYESLRNLYETIEYSVINNIQTDRVVDVGKMVFNAWSEQDTRISQIGHQLTFIYLKKRCEAYKAEKGSSDEKDNYTAQIYKTWIYSLLRGLDNNSNLTDIIWLLNNYRDQLEIDDDEGILKRLILFTPPKAGSKLLQWLEKDSQIKPLPVILDEETLQITIPKPAEYKRNFETFSQFLNDSCFDRFTSQELGEKFADLMIYMEDTTIHQIIYYGINIKNLQKKTKSKENKKEKNKIQEAMIYLLNHSIFRLREKILENSKKTAQNELDKHYEDLNSNMNQDLFTSMATILQTYKVDDPIILPLFKVFNTLKLNGKDNWKPDKEVAVSVLESILDIKERVSEQGPEKTELRK